MKEKLKGKKKLIIILAAVLLVLLLAAAAVLFFFRDRLFPPKEEVIEEVPPPPPVEAPVQYALGDVRVLALPTTNALVYDAEPRTFEEVPEVTPQERMVEKMNAIISTATFSANYVEPEPEPEPEEGEEEEEASVAVAYHYVELENPVELLERYAAMLMAEDVGFRLAQKDLKPNKNKPYFAGFAGEAYLTYEVPKPKPELDKDGNEIEPEEEWKPVAVAMRLEWRGDTCTVTLDLVPVSMVREPVKYGNGVPGGAGFAQTITFSGAVDTVKAMHPSVLGLPGESMEPYRVYSRDGIVKINDQPCMRLDVYSYDETIGANVIAGNYYLSSDGRRLYQFDEVNRKMTELSMAKS